MNAVQWRVRPANIVFGLLLLGTALIWAAWRNDVVAAEDVGRLVAAALIVVGLAGVGATLLLGTRRPDQPAGTLAPRTDHDDLDDHVEQEEER